MSILDYLPSKRTTLYKDKPSTRETIAPKIDIVKIIKDKLASLVGKSGENVLGESIGNAENIVRATSPSAEPTTEELIQAMQQGSEGDPVATMSGQMAETGQTMPIYKKYPFLPIATSQLESGGFKDFDTNPLVTRPKQGFGWGMNIPGYNPATVEKVLKDMMSAVGTDRPGEDPTRQRSASYYAPFRESQNLDEYAQTYAGPITEQNPNAGEEYATNLKSVMNDYAGILDEIMKKRGASYPTRY